MKKGFLLIIFLSLLLINIPNNVYENLDVVFHEKTNMSNKEQEIQVDLLWNYNTGEVKITHLSNENISNAITEIVTIKGESRISTLHEYDVLNDKFNVPIGTQAIKVHQVRILKGGIKYTRKVTGNNEEGSFLNVKRMNIVEIPQAKTNVVDTLRVADYSGSIKIKSYEFYFDFNKKHDKVEYIDVDYVVVSKLKIAGITWKTERYNVYDQELNANEEWTITGYSGVDGNKPKKYKILEPNSNIDFKENYVARIIPYAHEYNGGFPKQPRDYGIENFAVVKIAYSIDGEFIVDDVINDPVSPAEDLNWLLSFIKTLKTLINDFSRFWSTNSGKIIIGVIVIIGLIFLGPLIALIKLIFTLIKSIINGVFILIKFGFSIPGRIFKILKYLFVPKNKEKTIRRR